MNTSVNEELNRSLGVIDHVYKGKGVIVPVISMYEYLLTVITKHGPICRSDLVKLTRIPRTTVYDTLVKLILDEQIVSYTIPLHKRGRPRVYYEKNEKNR